MKKLRLLLMPLIAVSLLASCGPTKEYVTITFDAGIGAFEDANIIKTLTVKTGTKLNDCKIDKPIFIFNDDVIFEDDIEKEMDYWSNDKGEKMAVNYIITNDINLTANYYPMTDIKSLCIGTALDQLERAYAQKQTEAFEEYVQNYMKTTMNYQSSSQAIGCYYIAINTAFYFILEGDPILTYSNVIINYLDGILDHRSQVIGKLGGELVKAYAQSSSEEFTIFCYNYLFDFVKRVKYEYIPWADILCSSALQNIFKTYLFFPGDEVKEALYDDTAFFSNSIDVSKDSDTAHQISLIGAKFYEDVVQEGQIDIETLNRIFEEAKAKVEELL